MDCWVLHLELGWRFVWFGQARWDKRFGWIVDLVKLGLAQAKPSQAGDLDGLGWAKLSCADDLLLFQT